MTPYFTENISTDYYMNLYVKIYLDGSFCLFNRSLVMARINFVEVLKPTAKFLLLSFKMIKNHLDHLHAQDMVKCPTCTLLAYTVVSF